MSEVQFPYDRGQIPLISTQAAEDCTHPKTCRVVVRTGPSRSVLECAQSSAAFGPIARAVKNALPLISAIGLFTVMTAEAGTITGTVKAQGKDGAEDAAGGGKYASRQFKFAERVNYEEMHDFVVYIEGHVGTNTPVPDKPVQIVTTRPASVLQHGAMFEPHVLPIVVGTKVEWPNNDEIYHNVFSFSEPKQFDLGLYKKDDPMKSVTFDKPGRVDVFCSIHSRMSCIVLVLENPYFASTDKRGKYTIQNVPAGTYNLKAWHERLPSLTKEITVADSGETKVDFTLGIMNLPKP